MNNLKQLHIVTIVDRTVSSGTSLRIFENTLHCSMDECSKQRFVLTVSPKSGDKL